MKILLSILEELVACLTTQATGSGVLVIDIPLLRRQGFSSPGFSLSYLFSNTAQSGDGLGSQRYALSKNPTPTLFVLFFISTMCMWIGRGYLSSVGGRRRVCAGGPLGLSL